MRTRTGALVLLIPLVVACSGEPSENDIKIAVQDSYNQYSNLTLSSKLGGAILTATGVKGINVKNVEKINCVFQAQNSYICEYVVEYTIITDGGSLAEMFGVAGEKRKISRAKFLKTSKNWITSDE